MAYKSVLHSNRVFKDPGSVVIQAELDAPIAAPPGIVSSILVSSADDFGESGYVNIDAETFYYSVKSGNLLTGITRAVKGTSGALHLVGAYVIQTRAAPTDATPTTSNLAGWYTNGTTNQASLRVFDSPVIQQGVIRYNPSAGTFQGCTNTNPITWVEFNALQGDPGEPGIINALLTFSNVDDPATTTSNIGQIIKTTSANVAITPVPPIEVRTLVSGNVNINGVPIDTLLITQTANEIICTPQPVPFTWVLTDTISNLKGWNTVNQQAYNWSTTAKFPVETGSEPTAGQVVVSYVSAGNLLCVKPIAFTSTSNLNPLKVSSPYPPDLGIVGVCINNPTSSIPAIVATNGITQVRISTNSTPYTGITTSPTVPYSGKLCICNGSGYGINISSTITPPYVQLGTFLENTTGLVDNSNAIIRLDPRIITL